MFGQGKQTTEDTMAAETGKITIQIDEDALREQINGILRTAINDAADSLRRAADQLDGGEWARRMQEQYRADLDEQFRLGQQSVVNTEKGAGDE